jgi:poly-gamma-glutamate synthase PgsB/CapB
MMRSFANRGAEAAVVECMAVNPDYQEWLEDKVMHSHIGIITNVRIDHQEEMGQGLLAIARSISKTIPQHGILITSESNPDVLEILRQESERKHTQLIEAPVAKVTEAELKCFPYVAHKENVAIGLAIADLYGIKPGKALRAMVNTRPDPGAFEVETILYKGKTIKWANLFAVNDKESFAEISGWLAREYGSYHHIAILNNRQDRPSRVEMFCRLALNKLRASTVVAFGDYERRVEKFMADKDVSVLSLGNNSESLHLGGEELFDTIVMATPASEILLVGAVNIHTPQAERLLECIADLTGAKDAEHELTMYATRRFTVAGLSRKLQKRLALRLRYVTARSNEI